MVNYLNDLMGYVERTADKIQNNVIVTTSIPYFQFLWLFTICVFPDNLLYLKLALTGILCIYSSLQIVTNRSKLINKFLAYTLLFMFIYFLFLLYGLQFGYAFDLKIIEIFAFRPLVLFLLVQQIDSKAKFEQLIKSIITITFLLILYNIIYILGATDTLPKFMFWEKGVVIITDVFLAIRVSNQGTLMFLFPLNIILLSDIKNRLYSMKYKVLIVSSTFLGVLVVLFSGRRILQFITAIAAACFVLLILPKLKYETKRILMYITVVIFGLLLGILLIQLIGNLLGIKNLIRSVLLTFIDAVKPGTQPGTIRLNQYNVLTQEWLKKPILGWGLSAYVPYFIRSTTSKWSYEYVYIAFLFQTGVVGLSILCVYVLNILKNMFKKYFLNRKNEYGAFFLACIVGFICFLIAGATNPLVASMWGWYIALVCARVTWQVE